MLPDESLDTIGRREAIRRVTTILGGVALIGGSGLMAACERARSAGGDSASATAAAGPFTATDVAFLDEVADTILPDTTTPGAKAAKTGAFMALMVTDGYDAREQRIFRDGMRTLDDASRKANGKGFVESTPAQRTALLTALDREQKTYTDARDAARKRRATPTAPAAGPNKPAATTQPDQRAQNATATPSASAPGEITADSPAHWFRMMKELALLGYFTSEIGYTKAMRYVESPGRFDPCAPYARGEKSWAPHA